LTPKIRGGALFISLGLFLFQRLIFEVAQSIVTEICDIFDGDPNLYNWVKNLRPLPKNFGGSNQKILARFQSFHTSSLLYANISGVWSGLWIPDSGMEQDIVIWKKALQSAISPTMRT